METPSYPGFAAAIAIISHYINEGNAVLLASPEEPDADSCTSMFSFREFLSWLGLKKPCYLFAPNVPRKNTLFERIKPLGDPYTEINTELPANPPGLVIAFDYGQFWRTHLKFPSDKTFYIGFDHHPPKADDASFPSNGLKICNPSAPSTTALLYRFFKYAGFPIVPTVADCLLVGLMADTGKLSNSLTSPDALETAASLTRQGADYHGVVESMQTEISRRAFDAQMQAREKILFDEASSLGFMAFSLADLESWGNVSLNDILPLFGLIQNIRELRIAAAYFEREDKTWYCSLRSTPKKGVNVRKIALSFGGGGHDYAAAFVSIEPPEEIFKKLAQFLRE